MLHTVLPIDVSSAPSTAAAPYVAAAAALHVPVVATAVATAVAVAPSMYVRLGNVSGYSVIQGYCCLSYYLPGNAASRII